jgi:DNA-binding winged helix-turn-helix (wHTH) protein
MQRSGFDAPVLARQAPLFGARRTLASRVDAHGHEVKLRSEAPTAALLDEATAIVTRLTTAASALPAAPLQGELHRLGVIVRHLRRETRGMHVSLNAIVASAVGLVQSLFDVPVVTRLEEPLPNVAVDASGMERALVASLLLRASGRQKVLSTLSTTHQAGSVVLELRGGNDEKWDLRFLRDVLSRAGGEVRELSDSAGSRVLVRLPAKERVADTKPSDVLFFPPFRLDLSNETLWRGDTRLDLRAKPFAVLRHLAQRPQQLVTHRELIDAVWGKVVTSESLLRTHVRGLRKTLGKGAIETVTGRGYRFALEVHRGR